MPSQKFRCWPAVCLTFPAWWDTGAISYLKDTALIGKGTVYARGALCNSTVRSKHDQQRYMDDQGKIGGWTIALNTAHHQTLNRYLTMRKIETEKLKMACRKGVAWHDRCSFQRSKHLYHAPSVTHSHACTTPNVFLFSSLTTLLCTYCTSLHTVGCSSQWCSVELNRLRIAPLEWGWDDHTGLNFYSKESLWRIDQLICVICFSIALSFTTIHLSLHSPSFQNGYLTYAGPSISWYSSAIWCNVLVIQYLLWQLLYTIGLSEWWDIYK